ncbi:hypothetical protein ACHAXT_013225 [Thalassiosira profunda]
MPFWSRRKGDPDASLETKVGSSAVGDGSGALLSQSSAIAPTTSESISPDSSGGAEMNATVSEPWTRVFPEAYGIRQSIEDSSFRWCVRESMMWGVATGAVMGLHRLRMKSHPFFAINVAFGTAMLVAAPSYYFCFRRREHQERVIEMMMAANDFQVGEEMPEEVPLDKDHPFLNVKEKDEESSEGDLQKEFVARLKEKKEWQEPHKTQDADDVFKEVKR